MHVGNDGLAVNATVVAKLAYAMLRDLAPVSIIGRQPNALDVHPALKAGNVRELLRLARSQPGIINVGSGGMGTASRPSCCSSPRRRAMNRIPYKGLGPALLDPAAARVEMIVSTMASALPLAKAGKLRLLTVTTTGRSGCLPEEPTMHETGVPGYDFTAWYALVVPAATSGAR